jgi:RsiW-degrading membrane proteinase PrsW (M82 family)
MPDEVQRPIPSEETLSPYSDARTGEIPANVQDDWPTPPSGLAQIGYILLVLLGGATILGGAGYLVVALILDGRTLDLALAIALTLVGASILLHSLRAFDPRRWRALALGPGWVWLGAMVIAWGAGIGVAQALPDLGRWLLPPLIVIGSGTTSLLFLSTVLRGLKRPAGREALVGRLVPQHRLLLSVSLASLLSTGIALLLEAVALIGTIAIMLSTSQLVGDQATLDLLADLAEDPQALDRLEEMLGQSPVALAALGAILVFIAPAIEEGVKALPLFAFARQRGRLSERTAILLGAAGGVGFAFAENVGYLSALSEEWWLVFWFRAAAATMHGAASGFVGRAWWQAIQRGRWGAMLRDLGIGWGIHAFWNGLALVAGWFAYREEIRGVLFTVGIGLIPLAILFTLLARWGIWVQEPGTR